MVRSKCRPPFPCFSREQKYQSTDFLFLFNKHNRNHLQIQTHSEISTFLGSRLTGWNLLHKILKYVSFATAEMNSKIFSFKKTNWYFVMMFAPYRGSWTPARSNWVPFFDTSKVSLKAVFLHNRNKFPSVPLTHVANIKQSYENMKLLLKRFSMNNVIETFVGI